MSISFIPVKHGKDQEELARMAGAIWREYWPDLIGADQTEYMIERFQSLEAIQIDMAQNDYEYWFLVENEAKDAYAQADASDKDQRAFRIVGFTGGHNEPETNRFFISKIYLYASERGRGYARRVVEFYEALCFVRGLDALYLTVNKHNDLGVRAYKGTGFEVIDAVETDIGCGFIMDDYIMQKTIEL